MTEDEKVAFYLRHRRDIELWAALRVQAASELDKALRRAARQLVATEQEFSPTVSQVWQGTYLSAPVPEQEDGLAAGLHWKPKHLFHEWPQLAIVLPHGRKTPDYKLIRSMTTATAASHHLETEGHEFIWKTRLPVQDGEGDLDAYAQDCVARMRALWVDLAPLAEHLP